MSSMTGRGKHRTAGPGAGAGHPLSPRRTAPPGLPFDWSVETLRRGLNFTLTTTLGDINLLGDIPGGGGYERLIRNSVSVDLFGRPCRCLSLPALIRTKRAAGRPKDLETLAELEALLDEGSASPE